MVSARNPGGKFASRLGFTTADVFALSACVGRVGRFSLPATRGRAKYVLDGREQTRFS